MWCSVATVRTKNGAQWCVGPGEERRERNCARSEKDGYKDNGLHIEGRKGE